MIVTDLSTSYNPVPKDERKKNKKLIVRNCIYDEVCKREMADVDYAEVK